MLVQINCSSSCRGWEDNSSDVIETDQTTLRDYIVVEMLMNEEGYSREESNEQLDTPKDCFGWEVIDKDEISYEGEEVTVTYMTFKPDQEYVNMLLRNM